MLDIRVIHGSGFDSKSVDLKTDLVILNKEEGEVIEKNDHVLSLSLYGYDSDIKKALVQKRKIYVSVFSGKDEVDRFEIPRLDDYEIQKKEGRNGDFVRVVLTKKMSTFIGSEGEGGNNNPLLIVKDEDLDRQKDIVYNMVKNAVTTPMFPNVTKELVLAGQLFVDKEIAKKVIEYFNSGSFEKELSKPLIEKARSLLERYEEWKEYIVSEMTSRDLIKKVKVYEAPEEFKVFRISIDDNQADDMVQKGVKSGEISFSNNTGIDRNVLDFNSFMGEHAPYMAKRIESIAKPIHRNGDIPEATQKWIDKLERKPISYQIDAIEASIKSLDLKGRVNLNGEPGVGKTSMMAITNWVYNKRKEKTMKLLVFCPDSLVYSTWEKELNDVLPDVKVHIIKTVSGLMEFEKNGYFDDSQDRAFILSQGRAKSGYSEQPAVVWSDAQEAFKCPDCGGKVQKQIDNPERKVSTEAPTKIKVNVEVDYFKQKNSLNSKCKSCETSLWEPFNKKSEKSRNMVYIRDPKKTRIKGYYPKSIHAYELWKRSLVKGYNDASSESEKMIYQHRLDQLHKIEGMSRGDEKIERPPSPYRVPIADYIFKKMKRKFTNLIIDEVHEYQRESSRSEAFGKLIASVPVIQTGTGTSMNGYARSRFRTDFMLNPEKMKSHGFGHGDEAKYQITYGVTENRMRVSETGGKVKRTKLTPIEKPGISPVIFPLFMQDESVFIELQNLYDALPTLTHSQIEVDLDAEMVEAKEELEEDLKNLVKRSNKGLFRNGMQLIYAFLDSPEEKRTLKDPYTKDVLLETPVVSRKSDNKAKKLVELAQDEVVRQGRKMMVYTHYSGHSINNYLREELEAEGFNVIVMNKQSDYSFDVNGDKVKVRDDQRETWIKEQTDAGAEILLVNPELVKTGMNLIMFPTIVHYQMSHQVYTNRQADRRSYRIGQEQDCRIIYIYYKDTIQQNIASLMATKIVASQSIEGKMDAAGLEAILNERTAEEELAAEFYKGIRGRVSVPKKETSEMKHEETKKIV